MLESMEHLRPGPPRLPVWSAPTVFCYICGRQYGSKSITIHQPQCLAKWCRENDRLPRTLRRPEPVRPEPIRRASNVEVVDAAATNDAYFQASLAQLLQCEHCGRRFATDPFRIHQRSCTRERPARPVGQPVVRGGGGPRTVAITSTTTNITTCDRWSKEANSFNIHPARQQQHQQQRLPPRPPIVLVNGRSQQLPPSRSASGRSSSSRSVSREREERPWRCGVATASSSTSTTCSPKKKPPIQQPRWQMGTGQTNGHMSRPSGKG